jgi:hypothetical protein
MATSFRRATDFSLEIARGNIEGVSSVAKFGENLDIDTGAAEDIWDFGGLYTFSTSAVITTLSSSDNGDTQTIRVYGLDTNRAEVVQDVTLSGFAQATLGTALIRVNRMVNTSSTDIAGIVYCYETGTASSGVPDDLADVRAIIDGANNQTLMAIYTVPAGKTAYLYKATIDIVDNRAVQVKATLRVKPFGEVFQIKNASSADSQGSGKMEFLYTTPLVITEKSDIILRIDEVSSDNTGASGSFDLVLVDN